MLENENDYKRFRLEEERGRTFTGDLGQFLEDAWKNLGLARECSRHVMVWRDLFSCALEVQLLRAFAGAAAV